MAEEIYAILAGLKLAIFLSVLIMAFLVDIIEKGNKRVHGINFMAACLMLVAIFEFANIMSTFYPGFLGWFGEHENLHLVTKPFLLLSGIGLIWYLNGIRKNLKDYF